MDVFDRKSIEYINKLGIESLVYGYCKRCIEDEWKNANTEQVLYRHKLINKDESENVCFTHVGCREIANEILEDRKSWTDEQRLEDARVLGELIEEGKILLGKTGMN